MAGKNLEYNIHARIVADLRAIAVGSDYNYTINTNDVYTFLKMPTEVADRPNDSPVICTGDWTTSPSEMKRRTDFELPFSLELWGYVRTPEDPLGSALKLDSDIRVALGSDENLNELITEMAFQSDMGSWSDDLGIVKFVVSGIINYSTD